MITGDHAGTAVAIGRQLGLTKEITGSRPPVRTDGQRSRRALG